MTDPLFIYEQAQADIDRLASAHGITREQAAARMIDALKPAIEDLIN